MQASPSVAARAALALVLMVGFYALALLISAVLLYLPYAEVVYAHRLHPKLAFLALVGAGTILWSILPRPDRFDPPGPALVAGRQPRLFAQIEAVASATRQAMPAEVYLVGDVNAFVAQRGGVMGFFSRRVMGLGLPLLQALSVSELRAVLAHEFGHYHGGDTRLGPWVYKTRAAIGRTIQGLGDSALQKPFVWYGNLFLKISHAVSRRQELSADALASRVVGSRPLVEGLKKTAAAAAAYGAYWSQEVTPVLQAGYLPPIADGFHRFTANPRVAGVMSGALAQRLGDAQADPYDTHPPLGERIREVSALPPGPDPSAEPSAISLLDDLAGIERSWLASIADSTDVARLRPIDWDAVAASVLLPSWREAVQQNGASLRGATVGGLAEHLAPVRAKWEQLPEGESLDNRASSTVWLAGAALVVALERAGWAVESPVGSPVFVRRGDTLLFPFDIVRSLVTGERAPGDWHDEAARIGVDGLPLGPAEAAGPDTTASTSRASTTP
jgi:Zn-dependent protease with chaperone function